MRHRVKKKKLGRKAEHRLSLYRNQASSLFVHGYIKTTVAKAKALRPFAEKLITNARNVIISRTTEERLRYIRNITKEISDKNAYDFLIRVWAPLCIERPGGYTRIIKIGMRQGDSVEMAFIGIVIEEKTLAKYKLLQHSYKGAFKFLSEILFQDIPQPKILLKMWSICTMPKISTVTKFDSAKRLNFKINLSDSINLENINWPIYNGIYPNLPLYVEIVYNESSNKKLFIEKTHNLIEIPIMSSDNKIKVLYSPLKKEQFIEGSLKTISRRGSLKSLTKCRILVYNPIGLIFYQNLNLSKHE